MKDQRIIKFETLLSRFNSIPKPKNTPTFMDICHLWADRFEERCSQVLKFYLSPNEPHRLHGLFLNTILELLNYEPLFLDLKKIKVITEEGTPDGKKIDLTIIGEDFVIAIENKINAAFYNPVDSYVKHIREKYGEREKHFFVLLSVKRITDKNEIEKLKNYGYTYINYQEFFDRLKNKIGYYMRNADQTYLIFLNDFIKTIETRYYNNNMELKNFFFENRKEINHLLSEYKAFEEEIMKLRKERIAELKYLVSQKTGREWWAYQGWDLGTEFDPKGNRIGIESSFHDSTIENMIGDFHIYITVWQKRHFFPYEEEIKKAFPDCYIDYNAINGNRVFLHLPVIKGDETKRIVETLSQTYKTLESIVKKVNAENI